MTSELSGHTPSVGTPLHSRIPPGDRLRRLGISAWAIIGVLILAAALMWLLMKISIVFPPVVLALVIIYLLNPAVTKLHARGVPRGVGAIGCYLAVLAVLSAVVILLIPFVSRQVAQFGRQVPGFRTEIVKTVDGASSAIERRLNVSINTAPVDCLLGNRASGGSGKSSALQCDNFTNELRQRIGSGVGRIMSIGITVLSALLLFIVAPIIALYLLIDLPQLQRDALNLFPRHMRLEAADLGSKIGDTLGSYFRGQLVVALIVGLLSAIGFFLIHLPFWLIIGAIAGFFNLIPLIGPFIGGAVGFLVGSISGGFELGVKAAIVELVVQQIDNHIISPNVMKRAVQLHPVSVMLSLLAAGTLAGFWGMLLAVPTVATAKLLLSHLWTTRVLGEQVTPYGREPQPAGETRASPRLSRRPGEKQAPPDAAPSGAGERAEARVE